MSKTRILLLALGLAIGAGLLGWRNWAPPDSATPSPALTEAAPKLVKRPPIGPSSLPGDVILQSYAQPGTRPEGDLEALAHAFSNLSLLIKGDSPFRMGANEEFAAALLGKNRGRLRFVSDGHQALNERGHLIDRWGIPLHFHTLGQDRVDIRSAGPDRQMWTSDDLHRSYDGSFLKGEALNPDSLFQEATPGRSKAK